MNLSQYYRSSLTAFLLDVDVCIGQYSCLIFIVEKVKHFMRFVKKMSHRKVLLLSILTGQLFQILVVRNIIKWEFQKRQSSDVEPFWARTLLTNACISKYADNFDSMLVLTRALKVPT